MTTHYAEDKLARAQALGYQDYLSASVILYNFEELSFAQTGRYFNISPAAVRYRIRRAGMLVRGRGGNNHKKRMEK